MLHLLFGSAQALSNCALPQPSPVQVWMDYHSVCLVHITHIMGCSVQYLYTVTAWVLLYCCPEVVGRVAGRVGVFVW
jgi:hypothetical protein